MQPHKAPTKLSKAGVERGLERLRELVRERGLKASTVRENIARAALTLDGHFTIEELVESLPEAHIATVYRVLPLLVDAGLLQPAPASPEHGQRYERAFEREHHDHLMCTHCHKVVEFHSEALEELQRELASKLGFVLTGHEHKLFGTCSSCQRKLQR